MADENIFVLPSADQFDELNSHLIGLYEAKVGKSIKAYSWAQVQNYVRRGFAKKIFAIGDQLSCQKGDKTLYWDIIGIDYDTPADPQFTHSLTLQLHDCFPTPMQFDAPEALYYCHSALEAGTYHFAYSGTNYQFTTSANIDAGSQLILNFTDNTPTSIFVSATVGGDFVKDPNDTDNNLTIVVTVGSEGTALDTAPEALYYCQSALKAGTYHFTMSGTDYQFTTSANIAAGNQLIAAFTDNVPSSITVVDTNGNTVSGSPITVTAGSDGTPLDTDYINDINRVDKGSNNYNESALKQWLNSNAAAGSVWTPQNNFDRPPTWHSGEDHTVIQAGFMNGMDSDFLAVLGNVTKVTAKNTVTDGGGSDTTTEKFFLLSKSEVYGGLENGVDEGAAYPYYANYSGLSAAGVGDDGNRIKYIAIAQQLKPQLWWVRTPFYNSSVSQEYVSKTGSITTGTSARVALNVAPACNII